MRRTAPAPPHAIHHFHQQSLEDLRDRVPGAQGHQSRHQARRDLRPARPQRRRQDHADRHRLRHRQSERRRGHGRRPRHHPRLPRGALADRAGAAGNHDGAVRDRLGRGHHVARTVQQAEEPGLSRKGAQGPVAVGQAPRQDRGTVRRHEAARADRQGAEPRADDPVPRRADGGRRRRIAQGHVGGGARAARLRRHHHPHHALHRGSRGDGRPRRRHQQGRDDPGREQGRADAQARQEAPDLADHGTARRRAGRARRLQSDDRRRRPRARLTTTTPGPSAPASPRCSAN